MREQKAWDDRYLHIWTLNTGQVRVDGLFPPEQGEFIKATFDSLTSPRRGGVRFVDTERANWARRVQNDPRTTTQITCDGFIDLLKAGTTVNPHEMLGGRRPAVQILTTSPATQPTGPAADTAPTPGAEPAAGAAPGPAPDTGPHAGPTTAIPAEVARADRESGGGDGGTSGGSGGSGGSGAGRAADGPEPAHDADVRPPRAAAEHPPHRTDQPCRLDGPVPVEFLRTADDILICEPGQSGRGYLDGNTAPVSAETIERLICDSGSVDISFDDLGRPLDVGRDERLFSRAQRRALAARDGGCRWPGCDRPPAFTEAHHINHWLRDNGTTDINQGILLCRAHHLLLHNQRWQIFENAGRYWLRPPATVDPGQVLVEMPSRRPGRRS